MTNAWNFLSDAMDELKNDVIVLGGETISEATKEDWNDFWEGDGISLTGNPYYGSDLLDFSNNYTGSRVVGGLSDDTFAPAKKYKYDEEAILKELKDYINGTYNQHYSAGDDKIQTLDLIEACGDGESFCRSNILKYASRYDKKGTARRDIMKILHYAVLLMHFNDKNAKRETYPQ
tara:strand:+ start:4036 stop:4563 length:528 start_codon:yes stop_codon:yes gene_type:complete